MRPWIDVDACAAPGFGLSDSLEPFASEGHVHDKHQVLYVDAGTLHLWAQGGQWLLPPQRAAWIGAGVKHEVRAKVPVELRTVYFAPSMMRDAAPGCRVFAVSPLVREMIVTAMRWGPEHDHQERLPRHYFQALAALVEDWCTRALPLKLPAATTPELKKALEFTLENLSESLSIEDVARAAHVSSRTLSRRFSEETNMTWQRFLTEARVMRSMELLAQPGLRIIDIALEVGFQSQAAFTRAFHSVASENPKDYRQRMLRAQC